MIHILAANIRQRRVAEGLSQAALAARTGFSQTWISRMELGIGNPTIETLMTLAEALNTEAHQLLIAPPE